MGGKDASLTASGEKKSRKRVPSALRKVRKEIPPPGRVEEDKTRYDRKRAARELERVLRESYLTPNPSPKKKNRAK